MCWHRTYSKAGRETGRSRSPVSQGNRNDQAYIGVSHTGDVNSATPEVTAASHKVGQQGAGSEAEELGPKLPGALTLDGTSPAGLSPWHHTPAQAWPTLRAGVGGATHGGFSPCSFPDVHVAAVLPGAGTVCPSPDGRCLVALASEVRHSAG